MKRERRFDRGSIEVLERGDGFLRCRVAIARTGVFPYLRADGRVVKEAKLPEELFSEATIESAKGVPVIDEHPPRTDSGGLVNSENYHKYMKGALGDSLAHDEKFLYGHETIYDAELIEALEKDEKVEVSIGFTSRVDYTPGEFEGERYDAVQRDIRINHLAHTEFGRAGEDVRAYLDSWDGDDFAVQTATTTRSDGGYEEMNKKKILELFGRASKSLSTRSDSASTPAAPAAATADEALQKDINAMIDELKSAGAPADESATKDLADKISAMQSQIDTLNALIAEKTKLLEQAQSPEVLDSMVAERGAIIEALKSVDPEVKTDSVTNRALRLAYIGKVLPYGADVKADSLTDKEIGYRYDAALDLAREKASLRTDSTSTAPRLDAAEIESKRSKRLDLYNEK